MKMTRPAIGRRIVLPVAGRGRPARRAGPAAARGRAGQRRADGAGRGRGRAALVAVAWAVWTGTRRRRGLRRHLVRHRERAMEDRRSRAAGTRRPSSGGIASFSRRRTTMAGWPCSRSGAADGAPQWETIVPGQRGRAHQKNGLASPTVSTDGVRVYASFGHVLLALTLDGSNRLAAGSGADRATITGPPDRLCSTRIASSSIRTSSRIRSSPRSTPRRASGCGARAATRRLAGARRSRSGSARATRLSSTAKGKCRATTRTSGKRTLDLPRQFVRGDPHAGRRTRPGVLFVGPSRPDPGDSTRRHRRCVAVAPGLVEPARIAVRARRRSWWAMCSTWSTTWPASSPRWRRRRGKALWQGRLGVATREGFSASPVAVDGKVFFTNDDGDTFVLRAGADVRPAPCQPDRRTRCWPRRPSSTDVGTCARTSTSSRLAVEAVRDLPAVAGAGPVETETRGRGVLYI